MQDVIDVETSGEEKGKWIGHVNYLLSQFNLKMNSAIYPRRK
jgi:hypothetical protein